MLGKRLKEKSQKCEPLDTYFSLSEEIFFTLDGKETGRRLYKYRQVNPFVWVRKVSGDLYPRFNCNYESLGFTVVPRTILPIYILRRLFTSRPYQFERLQVIQTCGCATINGLGFYILTLM